MKTLPAIGARVLYTPERGSHRKEKVTGTVLRLYPGYGEKNVDPETGEEWITPDHVCMKVDKLPTWWAYEGTDLFAPAISTLSPLPKVEG